MVEHFLLNNNGKICPLFCNLGKECTEQLCHASPNNFASQYTFYIYFGSFICLINDII